MCDTCNIETQKLCIITHILLRRGKLSAPGVSYYKNVFIKSVTVQWENSIIFRFVRITTVRVRLQSYNDETVKLAYKPRQFILLRVV